MAQKIAKKQLGLGIKALLQDYDEGPPTQRASAARELATETFRIPLGQIEANPFQPRVAFDQAELQALAESIASLDVIQPVTVRRFGPDRYQLISGERRLRACRLAGLSDIPAYVRTADDQGLLEMAIVENVQRADLNPIETAVGYQRLLDEVGLTHEALSARVGKQRSTVTNALRLLKLPPEVQQALKSGQISAGHGRALAAIDDVALQLALLRMIDRDGLSVRQTEAQVKRLTEPGASPMREPIAKLSPVLAQIERELSSGYGTRINLKRDGRGKGAITIHFGSDQEFNRIIEQLRGDA